MPKLLITETMIAKKLGELYINKSCGPDQMHPHLLKEMANELSVPLSIIMNKSLRNKTLPKDWKKNKCFSII